MAIIWYYVIVGYLARISQAHVRLTFPPARYPPLDFLDNARTSPPCGVPKPPQDLGLRTTLKSGSAINVTWSLTYPHQGGFRIEVLDASDQVRNVLTPEKQLYTGLNEPTSQSYQVILPKDDCENCVIRLLRQAKEWSDNYQFWSCADVNIVKEPTEHCSEHGKYVNGLCQCERLYSGDQCQYKDECWTDQDCGSKVNGKCQDLEVVHYPRRVCYCEPGWFGPGCQQISPLKSPLFDSSLYQYRSFGEDENKLYWRILHESNEIEMILQYPSRSWIAIGWKPKNLSPQCSNLNNLIGLLYGTKFGGKSPSDSTHISVTSAPIGKPTSPIIHPATNKNDSSTEEFVQPPKVAWTPSSVGITGSAEEIPEDDENKVPVLSSIMPKHGSDNKTRPSVTDTIDIGVEPPAFPILKNLSKIENVTRPNEDEDEDYEETDETPKPTGTGISFPPGGTIDISISHPPIEIIPESSVTVGTGPYPSGGVKPASDSDSGIDDVDGDFCYGEWRWPKGCRECDYKLSWTYIEESDEIEFSIEAKAVGNSWTGVGFSKNQKITDSDFLVLKSVDNKLSVQDMFTSASNSLPQIDPQQNVNLPQVIGTHINDVLRAAFSRPRRTTDLDHDVQFTDTDCYYFAFPVVSGSVDDKGKMSQLSEPPKFSKQKVCIKTCNPSGVPAVIQKTCDKEFKFPPGCKETSCDYIASWAYVASSQSVSFNISSRELGRWTGIGFSKNGNMTGSDIILGWNYENGTYITDRFAYGKQQPAIDKQQDLTDIHGKIVDDIQTISFSRKLVTKDDKEDLSLKDCLYFLFPVGGGRVLARSTGDLQDKTTPVGFHDLYIPKVSKTPICICTDDGITVSGANITAPGRIKRAASTAKPEEEEYEYEEDNSTLTSANPIVNVTLPTKLLVATTEIRIIANSTFHPKNASAVPEPSPEPEGSPKPKGNQTTGKPQAEPEPEPTGEPHSHAEPTAEGEPGSALHPMDCSDMIIGSAIGSLSRVEDYYSINRATPMVDEVYGGSQSLTAATGFEENGITTVMFRRKLLSNDLADHNITDAPMTVIWAKGQEPGKYNHIPNSGLEASDGKASKSFYGHDVLAYHGHQNRGVLSMNFFEKPIKDTAICRGEQVYPPGCHGSICQYNVTWMKVGENVDFMMDVKMATNRWTGIGFSKDGAMAKSDAVIVQVNPSGPVEITDRYMPTYSKPLIDKVQNIFNVDAQYVNGRVKARFSRALATDDKEQDLNLTDCVFFLYPFEGGPVSSNEVLKHTETPARSEQICLNKCAKEIPSKDKGQDSSATNQNSKKFLLVLKILNEKWSDVLLDSNSDEFAALSNKVVTSVNNVLSAKFKGYQKAEVLRFKPGSVVADVQVTASGLNEQDILDTVASSSEVQSLRIDPNSVQVREIQDHPTPDEIRNYVIIAVACFLVVVASIFAVCMLLRTRKRRSKDLKANRPLVPFSPYAYMIPSGTYPPAYQYPSPNSATIEKKQFDNQGYHPDYSSGQQRKLQRHESKQESELSHNVATNGGNGARSETTTYGDWYHKVNAGQQQQAAPAPAGGPSSKKRQQVPHPAEAAQNYYGPDPRMAFAQPGAEPYSVIPAPYVQYPNDPYSYYTLNGNSRVLPRGGYYAPY